MKTVIVTGASGNLGQSVVRKFLSEGYRVIGTIIPNDPVQINIEDTNFEKVLVDLENEENTQTFIEQMVSKYLQIHAVVLTVGGFAMGKITDTKTSDITNQYKLNFETAYNVARPAFTHMVDQRYGRIFLVGSRPGLTAAAGKGMVAYGLSKSLLFRLAELMNDEAKGRNVITSVIVPSTIDTPSNRESMANGDFDSWVNPASIAGIIYFYCTDEANSVREPVIKVYNNA